MTQWIELRGHQVERLREALIKVFDQQSFTELLRYRLDKNLGVIVRAGAWQTMAFDVITLAERDGWVDDLILVAHEARPGYPGLAQLVGELQLGTSVSTPEHSRLQRYYQDTGVLLDPVELRARIAGIEPRVCRIQYPSGLPGKKVSGTGFLVAPDLVLTNYHVIKKAKAEPARVAEIALLFDYKVNAQGQPLNGGNVYRLAQPDWLVDWSDYTDSDLVYSDALPAPDPERLDYALLRLSEPAGCLPIKSGLAGAAGGAEPAPADEALRGWIEPPAAMPDLVQDQALFIMQHPSGGPLKLAWHPASVIGAPGTTRLRHRTSTLGGSSGSPCFDQDWRLVALHHAGDPEYDHPAEYNQAIPMAAILERLKARGVRAQLGGACG